MSGKEKIRRMLAAIVKMVSFVLVKMHVIRPKVIVHVDGGICSQMAQWLMGQYYTEGGFEVYYDLEWFKSWGKGIDGRIEMPFELQEMCPDIPVRQLSSFWNKFYRFCLRITDFENNTLPTRESIKHSFYITRYPVIPDEEWRNENFNRFFNIDAIKTVSEDKLPCEKWKIMCGIHVRRGDLAKLTIPGHYVVTPTQYFFDTIEYVVNKYKDVRFCFFSDELDFVESDILPNLKLPKSCDYVLMRGNKGHEDLVLLARCDMIIGSQGSASRYGAKMNPKAGLILPKVANDTCVGYEIIREYNGKEC